MKVFIVLAVFAAAASASLIASPGLGYNTYGLNVAPQLVAGVRSLNPIGASYVSPLATNVVNPLAVGGITSLNGVAPIGLGSQYVRSIQPIATRLVSSPVVAGVRTISPLTTGIVSPLTTGVVSPLTTGVVSPVSAYGVRSPLVSNIVAPSVYSAGYGSGLYNNGFLAKKL